MKILLKNILKEFYDPKLKCIHEKDFEALADSLELHFGKYKEDKEKLINDVQEVLTDWQKSLTK